jgi:hypothetical protein
VTLAELAVEAGLAASRGAARRGASRRVEACGWTA